MVPFFIRDPKASFVVSSLEINVFIQFTVSSSFPVVQLNSKYLKIDIFRIEIDAVLLYNFFSPVLHQLTFLEIKLLHSITEELFLCQTGSGALPEVCMSSRRPQN